MPIYVGERLNYKRQPNLFNPIKKVIPAIDPYAANTVLYLKGNGLNNGTTFLDESPSPKTITPTGNVKTSTAQSKYGGSSILQDGDTDRLSASSSDFVINTGNFTFELWCYPLSHKNFSALITTQSGDNATNGFFLVLDSTGKLRLYVNAFLFTGALTVLLNQWNHIAIVEDTGILKFFVNGVKEASSLTFANNLTHNGLQVGGASWASTQSFNGYFAPVKLTKAARYSANFNPETDTYLAY